VPSDTTTPAITPLAVGIAEAAAMIGISQSHLFAMQRVGKFGPRAIRLGRSRRFLVAEIRDWLQAGAPPRQRWETVKGGKP